MYQHFTNSFHLTPKNVLNVYLVGSRLWGTQTPRSDIDVLVVVSDLPPKLPKSQHKNQYDLTILTRDQFIARLEEGSLIETVCCLMDSSQECVWQETESMRHLVRDTKALDNWLTARQATDRAKAKKFWDKGLEESAFKILQYTIMSEYLLTALKEKERFAGGLDNIRLSMDDLHSVVQASRDDGDHAWMGCSWEEVEVAYMARLQKSSTRTSLEA